MAKLTVFVDESGTLPDPADKVIIIAAVGIESPEKLDLIFKQLRRIGKLRKSAGELKFYTAGEKTKVAFFEKIAKEKLTIFILTVDKEGRRIPDTPQNFAILCWFLLNDVFSLYQDVWEIVFDRHFSSNKDLEEFNTTLIRLLGQELILKHVDSSRDKRVNVADMVAGAVLAKETGKTNKFYGLIEKEVISAKSLNWVEVKRRFLANKKLA